MRLEPAISWRAAGRAAPPFDRRLAPLLAAIRAHATLRAAAQEVGLSYRAAWGLLSDTGHALGVPLVELQRGRGTRLSTAGEQLVAADARAMRRLRESALEIDIGPQRVPRGSARGLSVVASHDLLLAALCDHWARPEGLVGEVAFKGSLESLGALARGEADMAGFHAGSSPGSDATTPLRRLLDPRRDVLIRFAEREQGLMVKRGNPKRLRSLGDVAAKDARFVNRQRGSGTRLLIDQLLGDASIAPGTIRGYETEEFTHLAVAATVAAGRADAAFGLKAAAHRFGLDFIPVRREVYWLALRWRRLGSEAVRALCRGLAGEPLRLAARGLAGYSIRGAGSVTPVGAALA
ncbi:MAG TPA: substrate-binding domain-containing protein [Burkholderiales bacterium]|nr:substrate-binding domain-containing protein [Burkholderiales bacterium]